MHHYEHFQNLTISCSRFLPRRGVPQVNYGQILYGSFIATLWLPHVVTDHIDVKIVWLVEIVVKRELFKS